MSRFSAADHSFMARALRLARRGLNTATPNPRVGCVIVRDGHVVGEGWHEKAGLPHAEAGALAAIVGAGDTPIGATAYVTLEPCSHFGRTPPCADALIAAGVARAVVAMRDPNPLVAGQGLARLAAAGIEVASGLMEADATELNIGFVSRMTRGRPWLRLKVAASLDGKTALNNGVSQWITGPAARRDAHAWRARSCAVLTGIGTVRDDNPRLTVREVPTTRQPLRVVIDSRLETPQDAAILEGGNVLIAAAQDDAGRAAALRARGAEIVILPNDGGKVELADLLRELGRRGINEILAEAGTRLNGSLLREGCVDELLIYQAPLLMGDSARGMFGLAELTDLGGATRLSIIERRSLGADLRIRARLV
ncbi:MAG: bifunctional diaminohydroxyphosphoribosylaminopyrimidine deaminase/5-amino-6-(5-phosphoribosylamino)uracil reductase RibD [Sulfuritalea sp.]|jgi:diaminohydroxyphosphoribosylaminopyrimidine deaminase/5-amino-6-(5-phosphoribosylamino)uracil reductase|nr:bifunctional diaminohydroxyphosphoribosylaminopyrimidine deaminase/5-amino-6-(5-phosphoribosylamino)uracil reductase RibD [Sulfuritalea sp.]MBP7423825.1 bifunctional diaminohydroxyphosphoribosylaminopyrimidine deaminase/5-amino-6-(5-phosphoribosylamino)uracil reductase RibD [Sulfuritalea sp.]